MATIWNLENGVYSDNNGTLYARTFNGSYSSGDVVSESVIIDSETGDLTAGGDTTATFTGAVYMDGLPVADPGVAGQFWNSSGTLKVSSGS